MAYMCDYCGKGVQYGGWHAHGRGVAGGRWKKKATRVRKVFKPNLHAANIEVGGKKLRLRLCTKCLRKIKNLSGIAIAKVDKKVSGAAGL